MDNKAPFVIIVWISNPDSGCINTVSFGNGESRVYEKDRLDPRLGDPAELPYFRNAKKAALWMHANIGRLARLDLFEARRYGLAW